MIRQIKSFQIHLILQTCIVKWVRRLNEWSPRPVFITDHIQGAALVFRSDEIKQNNGLKSFDWKRRIDSGQKIKRAINQ